ncbi:TIR domain-containing protein [Denitromonas iodatirespirans]|uniref:TIR domain-containing protein n=1 Tax=Denitromonas iodatirespirans TaxID=2795389 RepID=A0A944D6H7_DENI1|nr:TIR domain-containing protein [Denitromonas iodatirespirans]MBT0960740.1 TIR domain-containing protein [Denitromonas iodatirespirans]
MDGIFISYRRDDSAGYAGRLYDRLAGHFGPDRVFMDVEGIEPGTDFVNAIESAVASCRVLIVLIGDEWLTATDARGRRRLDDPHDFIRLETRAALARDIRVVPVLLDRATMPTQEDLPDDLHPLVRRQAVELNHKQWEATSKDLIHTLEKILASTDAADAAPPPATTPAPAPTTPPAPPASTAPATPHVASRRPWWGALAALLVVAALVGVWSWWPPASQTPPPPPAPGDASPSPSAPAAAPPAAAHLVADQTDAGFAPTEAGQRSHQEVRLRNTGDAAADIASTLEDPDGVFKILVDTCGNSLRPGAGCSYTLAFAPVKPGRYTGRLSVTPAGGEAITWPLTAQADAPPAPAVTPAPPPTPPVAARPTPEPAPTPPPAPEPPRILSLEARPDTGGVTVCYRVQNSTRLTLTPRPGELPDDARNCIKVPLADAATLTLNASGPGGSVQRSVRATPLPAPAPSAHPRPGDTWIYRSRGKWPTSPARTLQFTTDRVDGSVVYETLTVLAPKTGTPVQRRSPGPRATMVNWGDIGWEFSPWLGAFDLPEGSRSWRDIDTPPLEGQWRDWSTVAEVDGRERIRVPAGSFDTVRLEVWSTRRPTGGPALRDVEPTTVHFDIWYAPEAKRYVKMVRTTKAPSNAEIEKDVFELVEIRAR